VEDVLQQILSVWSALDMRRRVIVVAATLAMFAAVLGLGRSLVAQVEKLKPDGKRMRWLETV